MYVLCQLGTLATAKKLSMGPYGKEPRVPLFSVVTVSNQQCQLVNIEQLQATKGLVATSQLLTELVAFPLNLQQCENTSLPSKPADSLGKSRHGSIATNSRSVWNFFKKLDHSYESGSLVYLNFNRINHPNYHPIIANTFPKYSSY